MKKNLLLILISSILLVACSSGPSTDTSSSQFPETLDEQTIKKSLPQEQLKVSELVEKGNLKGCQQIQAPHLKEQCLVNIYLAEALSTKDPASCEKITFQEVRDLCLQQLQN